MFFLLGFSFLAFLGHFSLVVLDLHDLGNPVPLGTVRGRNCRTGQRDTCVKNGATAAKPVMVATKRGG